MWQQQQIRKGNPGLRGVAGGFRMKLDLDSTWFHRTSDGVAGRLAQEVQILQLVLHVCRYKSDDAAHANVHEVHHAAR